VKAQRPQRLKRAESEEQPHVLLATRSEGKLRELKAMFEDVGMSAMTLNSAGIARSPEEDEIECYDTFEGNALAKARYFHGLTGLPTVADDSGLRVDALGGKPGVWSKRFSGRSDLSGQALDDANNTKLLDELRNAKSATASYACAAAFVDGAEEIVTLGETFGLIVRESRGDNGFGYDPYFFSTELQKTFGEAGIHEKAAVSHRGRAFQALLAALRERDRAL